MEAYLEDNRPTIDEVCESYDECTKECPAYRFCHPQAEANMAEKVEVVIKIPKYYLTHPQDYSCLAERVRRGVPLPKGHGDLIDRQSLIDNGTEKGFCDWYDEIKYADTIIEADKAESEV